MEVVVPFDESIQEVGELGRRFPAYRFVDLGRFETPTPAGSEFSRHMLYDRRRSGGLKAARGRYVAMLEDRGWPRPDWARTMVRLHQQFPHAAIGGAIVSGAVGTLRQAAFFCDFGRYEPPLEDGDAEYLSDINICYKREALESVRALWDARYQEATVNWALRRQGCHLYLAGGPQVVEQRGPMRLLPALAERVHWGRTFGYVRGRESSRIGCILRAGGTTVLPAILLWRHLSRQFRHRRPANRWAYALPATACLMLFWSIGEMVGELEAIWAPRNALSRSQGETNAVDGVRHEESH